MRHVRVSKTKLVVSAVLREPVSRIGHGEFSLYRGEQGKTGLVTPFSLAIRPLVQENRGVQSIMIS